MSKTPISSVIATLAAAGIVLSMPAVLARVDVRVQFEEKFDFTQVRTWSWQAGDKGQVLMARSADDSAASSKALAEPIIVDAVAKEMVNRKLKPAASAADADVTAFYYLLLTTTMNSQVMGQFFPANAHWRLPNFPAATQSLEMMNAGTLVLDLSAKGNLVWRGAASAKIPFEIETKKRETLVREAVRDMLRRFPPKK
jgi:hypothetical protein